MAKGYIRGAVSKGFKPPPEVLRYFSDKSLRPRFSWLDVWAEEHAHAFTVAKAVELDLLQAFRKSIDKALREGQSYETWQKGLQPELEKLGWWGRRTVVDPGNSFRKATVDFSAPRRLQTIFWSNMRAARAAGQWERIQRSKRSFPLLLYVQTTSADPREEHRQWWGLILPVDHPFWRSHFPPNGWGCKCAVRAVTKREAEGYRGQKNYSFEAPTIETERFVNRRTGEVTAVPVGIDPGWHTNPGLSRARTLTRSLVEKIEAGGERRGRKAVRDLWASDYPKVLAQIEERVHAPVAVSARAVEAVAGNGSIVTISNTTLQTKVTKHAVVDVGRFRIIQMLADQGAIIDMGKRGQWCVGWHEGQLWKVALKRSSAGYAYAATFHPIDIKQLPKGIMAPDLQG
jgi:Phage Mu protein F like protein